MANNRKLMIRTAAKPALVISRPAFSAERLVYIAVANKKLSDRAIALTDPKESA
jgi:hypothetical protein